MGVGTEWNSALIKDLAKVSDGRWYYIDAEQSDEAMRVFLAEFDRLADTTFLNVRLEARPVKDVKVKRVRQVTPQIKELPLAAVDDRLSTAPMGALGHSTPTKYILDLSLPRRPDGKYVVAQVEVKYELGDGQVLTTGPTALEMAYTAAGHGYDECRGGPAHRRGQIYQLNANPRRRSPRTSRTTCGGWPADRPQEESPRAPGAKKTMLAQQVLAELDGGGRVSRETMLAVDDAADDGRGVFWRPV